MAWHVGPVQNIQGDFAIFSGSGFNIVDATNRPIVTFGYLSHAEATRARDLIADALRNAKHVVMADAKGMTR
jgi:hypothetical protein